MNEIKFEVDIRPKPHFIGERCQSCDQADYTHPRDDCSEFVSKMLKKVEELEFHDQLKIAALNYLALHRQDVKVEIAGQDLYLTLPLSPISSFSEVDNMLKLGIWQKEWIKLWLPRQSSGDLGDHLIANGFLQAHELYANVNPPTDE